MRQVLTALRSAASIAVVLVLCWTPGPTAANSGRAGLWVGHASAARLADLSLVTVASTYDSEFWFVVRGDSSVSGEATVRYVLDFSDARLRTLIEYGHWGANSAIANIPGINGLFGAALSTHDLLGMRMQYAEFAPLRRGRITGALEGDRLTLRWAEPPPPLSYQEYAVYRAGDKVTKTGTHPAYQPWLGEATVTEPVPGHFVATSSPEASRYHNGDVSISAVWIATRQN